jgi:hypothetical protein
MKKLILLLALIFSLSSICQAAELLVKAEDSWGTNEARSRKGDIIVVKPDGWKWGKEECPPRFVVVKLKDVTVEDVKYLEQPLYDMSDPKNPVILKRRQYSIDKAIVDDCVKEVKGAKEISTTLFNSKLIDKSK